MIYVLSFYFSCLLFYFVCDFSFLLLVTVKKKMNPYFSYGLVHSFGLTDDKDTSYAFLVLHYELKVRGTFQFWLY